MARLVFSMLLVVMAAGAAAGAAARAAGDEPAACEGVLLDIPGVGGVCGGRSSTARLHKPIRHFLGIPFAQMPERFQPSTTFATWDGVLDATQYAKGCPQPSDLDFDLGGLFPGLSAFTGLAPRRRAAMAAMAANASARAGRGLTQRDPDNCLVLDIYTPDPAPSEPLPVFLFVHGGFFLFGTSSMANGDFLLEYDDLVLVSMQYRLGPDGFMSLEEEGAPGNAAMYDHLMALRWLKQHIGLFGGDPEHIVIGGISAGAATSSLVYVSPLTRDMISGAVLFSGGALAPWTVDADPLRSARAIGVFMLCLRPEEVVGCLQNRSPVALMASWLIFTVIEKYFKNHGMGGIIPVVQSLGGDMNFLPRHSKEELEDEAFPAKPLLIGVAKNEGTFLYSQVDIPFFRLRQATNDPFVLDHALGEILAEFVDIEDPIYVVSDALKRLYFGEDAIGNYSLMYEGLVDFTGAGFFKGPAQRMALLAAERGADAFLYQFDYARGGGGGPVSHGHDMAFLVPSGGEYTEQDYQMVDMYCELVTSFVRDLKPRVRGLDWQPYSYANERYVKMDVPPQLRKGFSQEFYVMERERQEAGDDGGGDDGEGNDSSDCESGGAGNGDCDEDNSECDEDEDDCDDDNDECEDEDENCGGSSNSSDGNNESDGSGGDSGNGSNESGGSGNGSNESDDSGGGSDNGSNESDGSGGGSGNGSNECDGDDCDGDNDSNESDGEDENNDDGNNDGGANALRIVSLLLLLPPLLPLLSLPMQ